MKLSKKQLEEVDFLCYYFMEPREPAQEEIDCYILVSVHGKGTDRTGIFSGQRNFILDRKWLWDEDLGTLLLSAGELREFGDHPFSKRVINSLLKRHGFVAQPA